MFINRDMLIRLSVLYANRNERNNALKHYELGITNIDSTVKCLLVNRSIKNVTILRTVNINRNRIDI